MSIPMTCGVSLPGGQHDIVFHVLCGGNKSLVMGMVECMAHRLGSLSETSHLNLIVEKLRNDYTTELAKATWILLLNVDMKIKELLMEPTNARRQKACLTYAGQDPSAFPAIQASLSLMTPMEKGKAARFLMDLHTDLIPKWLQNEVCDCSDLVRQTMSLYLNS